MGKSLAIIALASIFLVGCGKGSTTSSGSGANFGKKPTCIEVDTTSPQDQNSTGIVQKNEDCEEQASAIRIIRNNQPTLDINAPGLVDNNASGV